MRLRKLARLCEHDSLHAHHVATSEKPQPICPGGEFLPEGVPIDWCVEHESFQIDRSEWDEPYCFVWSLSYSETTDPKHHPKDCRMVDALAVLDALASQVGETE